ncbi:hypothetical protein BX616_005282 [Lobosporangium transversale]|uniref:F-box domain-containing protein n=1 Tax=Lobosporangium transversale TaxID=64571 RepID=A0A1Y2H3L6_9FUNG|nr:hypothetical protein BCR41DRAFT_343801 [Lobosporangium transversale]KAF9897608.1 hypothetical protein BX616_005282 [Lobosporangium transversale]ORZ28624.1 hypothetical protein BCR41DRAFT_343801 [Lobosporangium transversale]|eukprot:XP_021886297.1 hypothetical protein BCR41DRAFT_343801 [Lobosporangium transversale]
MQCQAFIHSLPTEILAAIFGYEGLADITRQVCKRWRAIALPIWLKRLVLLPSDPFKDLGIFQYLQHLSLDLRLSVRALEITSRRDFDLANNSVFYTEVADQACVQNAIKTQSLLGPRIMDLTLTDTGWAPESLRDILRMNLMTTDHLHHFQISLFKTESHDMPDLMDSIVDLYRRDACHIKSLVLDLAQPLTMDHWEAIAECIELQSFHLGLHRISEPILTDVLERIFPKWTNLCALYICQPRFLSAETLRCLYKYLPHPDQLHELHLIFEACQASLYEQEFIEMIHTMPNLQILEAHLDWSNLMMKHVAVTLSDLRELSITCSNLHFTCAGISSTVWGPGLEKLNMRTSGKICGGFLEAVRKRSRRVKILVYGSMKWGGSVDEWE